MKYNTLYIGGVTEYKNTKFCTSYSLSADGLQSSILNGLEENNESFYFINSPFKVIEYTTTNIDIPNHHLIVTPKNKIISIVYKYVEIIRHIKKNRIEYNQVFVYSYNIAFVLVLRKIKRKYPNIVTSVYIPDLPEYMNLQKNKSFIYRFLKKIEIKLLDKFSKYIEKYILISEHMANKLKLNRKQYLVIEGMISARQLTDKISIDKRSITYAGTLNYSYGIQFILDLVKVSDSSITYNICGDGEAKNDIIEMQKKYKNLIYHGKLSKNEMTNILDRSTILINPRMQNNEYVKFSFPSKTLDYLQTNRPVLGFKLDGIPEQYDQFIRYFPTTDIMDCYNFILDTFNDIIKYNFNAQLACKFIKDHKQPKDQVKKILEFISNIEV